MLNGPTTDCPKFIVVARNPKDTLVSLYHFHRLLPPLGLSDLTWSEFFRSYEKGMFMYGDLVEYNLRWWQYKGHPNVLFMQYEEMLVDSVGATRQVANFMGRTLSVKQLDHVAALCSFEAMKQRGPASYLATAQHMDESAGSFFRKGIKGDWKNHFTDDQSTFVDKVLASKSDPHGLNYSF